MAKSRSRKTVVPKSKRSKKVVRKTTVPKSKRSKGVVRKTDVPKSKISKRLVRKTKVSKKAKKPSSKKRKLTKKKMRGGVNNNIGFGFGTDFETVVNLNVTEGDNILFTKDMSSSNSENTIIVQNIDKKKKIIIKKGDLMKYEDVIEDLSGLFKFSRYMKVINFIYYKTDTKYSEIHIKVRIFTFDNTKESIKTNDIDIKQDDFIKYDNLQKVEDDELQNLSEDDLKEELKERGIIDKKKIKGIKDRMKKDGSQKILSELKIELSKIGDPTDHTNPFNFYEYNKILKELNKSKSKYDTYLKFEIERLSNLAEDRNKIDREIFETIEECTVYLQKAKVSLGFTSNTMKTQKYCENKIRTSKKYREKISSLKESLSKLHPPTDHTNPFNFYEYNKILKELNKSKSKYDTYLKFEIKRLSKLAEDRFKIDREIFETIEECKDYLTDVKTNVGLGFTINPEKNKEYCHRLKFNLPKNAKQLLNSDELGSLLTRDELESYNRFNKDEKNQRILKQIYYTLSEDGIKRFFTTPKLRNDLIYTKEGKVKIPGVPDFQSLLDIFKERQIGFYSLELTNTKLHPVSYSSNTSTLQPISQKQPAYRPIYFSNRESTA